MAKGAFWSMSGSIMFKLVSFFYTILVARMVAPNDLGNFYTTLSIMAILLIFIDLGLSKAFARYIPYFFGKGDVLRIKKTVKMSYAVSGLLAVIFLVLVYLLAGTIASFYNDPTLVQAIQLLSPYILVDIFLKFNTFYLRARKNIFAQSVTNNIQNLSKFVFSIILFTLAGADMVMLILAFLLSFVLAFIYSSFQVLKDFRKLGSMPEGEDISYKNLFRELMPFGLIMSAVSSLWLIITSSDKIMIKYFVDPAEASTQVAVYTIATSMSLLIFMVNTAVNSVFYPLISQLLAQDKKDQIRSLCNTSMRWILFLAIPFTLVFTVFPEDLLGMFYAGPYRDGGPVMSIFTFGVLLASFYTVPVLVLASMKLLKYQLRVAAIVAVVNVLLNLILIPQFGMIGAAITSTFGFILALLLYLHYAKRFFSFTVSPNTYKIFFAGFVSLVILFFARPYLLPLFHEGSVLSESFAGVSPVLNKAFALAVLAVIFAVACVIFYALLLLLKTFRHDDLDTMSAIVRKMRAPAFMADTAKKVISFGIPGKEDSEP